MTTQTTDDPQADVSEELSELFESYLVSREDVYSMSYLTCRNCCHRTRYKGYDYCAEHDEVIYDPADTCDQCNK